MAIRVLEETGLLPHLNPGVMSWEELTRLKPVSPSMGMMLETTSRGLFELWDELSVGDHRRRADRVVPAIAGVVLSSAEPCRNPWVTKGGDVALLLFPVFHNFCHPVAHGLEIGGRS